MHCPGCIGLLQVDQQAASMAFHTITKLAAGDALVGPLGADSSVPGIRRHADKLTGPEGPNSLWPHRVVLQRGAPVGC